MTMNPGAIGDVAFKLIQEIEEQYGQDAEIDTVAVIAHVKEGSERKLSFRFSEGTPFYIGIPLLELLVEHLKREKERTQSL